MASKSKRRGRVFRASCILAALIIAGSSFAWFASKDEVTNRLAASADYNVSIIENFVPPKQWVPGQTVEKDEAVVNTGAVDAFVKQTISGNLEVTVEVPATVSPLAASATEKENYITLTEYEHGTLEAGSCLAWKPAADATNELGVMIGIGLSDGKVANEFKPAATGLYVFRRAVHKNTTTEATDDEFNDVSYDYVGYWYDSTAPGTYYKLYDIEVDPESINAQSQDSDTQNGRGYMLYGTLTKEPIYSWAKLATTTANKVTMKYEKGSFGDDGLGSTITDRLVVSFNAKNTVDGLTSATDSTIYSKYHNYLDLYNGRTNYVAPTETTPTTYPAFTTWNNPDWTDASATKDSNQTGLTNWDAFNNATTGADDANTDTGAPKDDLSNMGYERLEALKTQTDAARKTAEGYNAGTGEYAYATEEVAAEDSRQTVNNGLNAADELDYLYRVVTKEIGTATSPMGATPDYTLDGTTQQPVLDPGTGLYLIKTQRTGTTENPDAPTFQWYAKQLYDPNDTNNTAGLPYIMDVDENMTYSQLAAKWFKTGTDESDDYMDFTKLQSVLGTDDNRTNLFTADTLKEGKFADPEQDTNDRNDQYSATTPVFGSGVKPADQEKPYKGDLNSTLSNAWDDLLFQTQRKALNLIKKKMLEEVIASTTPGSTDANRKIEEAQLYINFLDEQMNKAGGIQDDYEAAAEAYKTIATKVRDMLKLMKDNQDRVNLANYEYDGYYTADSDAPYAITDASNAGADTTYNNVTWSQATAKTVVYGALDSVDENTFEERLINIFGVAKKDTVTTKKNDENGETHKDYSSTSLCTHKSTDPAIDGIAVGTVPHKEATDKTTYGYSSTMLAVTKNLDYNTSTGVITPKSGTFAAGDPTIASDAEMKNVKNAPFYKDYVTGKMKDFREGQANTAYGEYQTELKKKALYNSESTTSSDEVKLYVNLANIAPIVAATGTEGQDGYIPAHVDPDTGKDKWQYMGKDGDKGTDFIFGYTGILESSKASSILIDSVKFDGATKQSAFKDLKFDINVLAESAQVVFNGSRVKSDAAKTEITLIEPTEDEYESSKKAVVTWTEGGAATTPTVVGYDNDPSPKDVEVAPARYTYTLGTNALTAAPEALTPALVVSNGSTTNPETITMMYKVVVSGATDPNEDGTYYGVSDENGTEFYQLNADGTAIDSAKKLTLSKTATAI